MSHSTLPDCEPNSASTLPEQPGVLVVRKHHFLVRWSHCAECADPSWPHSEWHLYLLGFADLSTQARSEYGKRRCGCGYWNLDMRPPAWPASLQQSARLDLQPHEPWARHVGISPAPALVVRVSVHAEWHCVRCRAGNGRRLALLAASPDRSA